MKKILLASALLLALVAGIVFVQNYLKVKKSPTVRINDHSFQVRIADSDKEREIGLSETKSLPENQGMIFIFEKPDYYSFWMKNMTIPIDIIYINGKEIVMIQSKAQPPTNSIESPVVYTPTELSDKVLEINAGLSEKYNFKKGDKIKYEDFSNRNKL